MAMKEHLTMITEAREECIMAAPTCRGYMAIIPDARSLEGIPVGLTSYMEVKMV